VEEEKGRNFYYSSLRGGGEEICEHTHQSQDGQKKRKDQILSRGLYSSYPIKRENASVCASCKAENKRGRIKMERRRRELNLLDG